MSGMEGRVPNAINNILNFQEGSPDWVSAVQKFCAEHNGKYTGLESPNHF